MTEETHRWKLGAWRDWASLARLPNLPTVWSNVFTAWALAGGMELDHAWLLLALAGGSALYAGGTTLNDVKDLEFDRKHRPERPLPGGRVSPLLARRVAIGLLALGALCLFGVLNLGVLALLGCIVLYARLHKEVVQLGVLLMGFCRMTLAMSVATMAWWLTGQYSWNRGHMPEPMLVFWIAALFAYVIILTWVAVDEHSQRRRKVVSALLLGLPALDAVFLALNGQPELLWAPTGCLFLAALLRRVASAT